MDSDNSSALDSLIHRLPFPLVLFGNGSRAGIANERFADAFGPGQLENLDLHRLAHNLGGAWQSVKLRHRDGRDLVASVQAIAVADGVLLVFDEAAGPMLMQKSERLQERVTELESLSAVDPLTGAWNRVQLEQMVGMETSRANRSGRPVTLVLLDIDHFKRVVDVYGYPAGDAVLTESVARMRKRMRHSDALFRWGGDEFAVLATSVGYRGGAILAEDLRSRIAARPFAQVGPITVSLGVAEYLEGESATGWFQRADQALYAAKSAGPNRVHIDRQGTSDLLANRVGTGVLRLHWQEAYECGERAIDAQDRQLFDLGNTLIAAAIERCSEPGLWREALDTMLTHLVRHFQAEEALMARNGYARLAEHQRAHAGLLLQIDELKAAVEGEEARLGDLGPVSTKFA